MKNSYSHEVVIFHMTCTGFGFGELVPGEIRGSDPNVSFRDVSWCYIKLEAQEFNTWFSLGMQGQEPIQISTERRKSKHKSLHKHSETETVASACVSQCLYRLLCLRLCFSVFVWTLALVLAFLSVCMDSCA